MRKEVLWRDTGIMPQIGPLDARAIFPLMLWLFHWSNTTAIIALSCIAVLFAVQRTGMSPVACLRFLRMALMGHRRETLINERHWRQRCRW